MAFDAFLKIDGIVGESRDAKMSGAIDVLSYSFGVANSPGGPGGGSAGKPDFTDLSFVVRQSAATVPLLSAVAAGTHHKTGELILRSQDAKSTADFFSVRLTDVVVTSLHEAASTGGERPADELSLAYSTIAWSYRAQNPDGSLGTPVTGGWDLAQNKKI